MNRSLEKFIPNWIKSILWTYKQHKLKIKIIKYLENLSVNDMTEEKKEILTYLKHNNISYFPYNFVKKYRSVNIVVYKDENNGMNYVLHDGKCLYFKRGWTEDEIRQYYMGLLVEQDLASPHRYETSDFKVEQGDIVVDAGVAEGNFALSVVDRAKKLYLFEPDSEWVEPLLLTFAPFKEKVTIEHSYISAKSNGTTEISLDDYFGDKKIDFIKADIEGAEPLLLEGAKRIMEKDSPKIAICTYHRQDDAENCKKILESSGYGAIFSNGYMLYLVDNLMPPYIRKCLIRAQKLRNEKDIIC